MIIQLLITFTYIRTWTVEKAVCMHGELIKVWVFFHISSTILLIEDLVVQQNRHKLGEPASVLSYRAREIPGNGQENKQTCCREARVQEHTAAIETSMPPPPPSTARVKNQISPWQPPPEYPEVRNHNLIQTSYRGQPEPLTWSQVKLLVSPLQMGDLAQLFEVRWLQSGNWAHHQFNIRSLSDDTYVASQHSTD